MDQLDERCCYRWQRYSGREPKRTDIGTSRTLDLVEEEASCLGDRVAFIPLLKIAVFDKKWKMLNPRKPRGIRIEESFLHLWHRQGLPW